MTIDKPQLRVGLAGRLLNKMADFAVDTGETSTKIAERKQQIALDDQDYARYVKAGSFFNRNPSKSGRALGILSIPFGCSVEDKREVHADLEVRVYSSNESGSLVDVLAASSEDDVPVTYDQTELTVSPGKPLVLEVEAISALPDEMSVKIFVGDATGITSSGNPSSADWLVYQSGLVNFSNCITGLKPAPACLLASSDTQDLASGEDLDGDGIIDPGPQWIQLDDTNQWGIKTTRFQFDVYETVYDKMGFVNPGLEGLNFYVVAEVGAGACNFNGGGQPLIGTLKSSILKQGACSGAVAIKVNK